MYSPTVQKLIEVFSKFPTVGQRTAARFVFYLLKMSPNEFDELIKSISQFKKEIQLCGFCFNPYEAKGEQQKTGLCLICENPLRDRSLLCVVEKESDLEALEKTKTYGGLYFILGGTVGSLRKEEITSIRVEELKERVQNPERFGFANASWKEIILAINPTTEGEATVLYVERFLKPLGISVTRLARGLPIGGELEYADEETLRNAFAGRR